MENSKCNSNYKLQKYIYEFENVTILKELRWRNENLTRVLLEML